MTAPAGTTAAGPAAVLDEIRQRVEAATKGPWLADVLVEAGSRPVVVQPDTADHDAADILFAADAPWVTEDDAEFVAHARRDIPRLLTALDAAIKPHIPIQLYRSADDCGHEMPPEPDWKAVPDQAAIDAWDAWHEEHTAGNGPGSSDSAPLICMLSPDRMACPACSALIYETWGDDDRFVDASECTVWPAFAAALTGEETTCGLFLAEDVAALAA